MPDKEIKRIPAQYIGTTMLLLMPGQGTGFNADGTRRTTRTISQGDILLMPEREILGFTLLYRGEQPLDMGTGKVVKAEHAGLSEQELTQLGYQFHQGRTDFVPYIELAPVASDSETSSEQVQDPESPADEQGGIQ